MQTCTEPSPMTVIAALVESDDALLLAADSGETQTPGPLRSLDLHKLHRHPVASLAWGVTGDVQISQEFSAWLEAYAWPPGELGHLPRQGCRAPG